MLKSAEKLEINSMTISSASARTRSQPKGRRARRRRQKKAAPPPQDFSNVGRGLVYGFAGALGGLWPVGGCGSNTIGALGAGFELGGGHFHGNVAKKAGWMTLGTATGVALNLGGTIFAPATHGLSMIPSAIFGAIAFGIAGAAEY